MAAVSFQTPVFLFLENHAYPEPEIIFKRNVSESLARQQSQIFFDRWPNHEPILQSRNYFYTRTSLKSQKK